MTTTQRDTSGTVFFKDGGWGSYSIYWTFEDDPANDHAYVYRQTKVRSWPPPTGYGADGLRRVYIKQDGDHWVEA